VGYDLAALVPVTREAMLLVAVFLKALTFALLAFVLDRRGHTLISAIVTAGAWPFVAFGAAIWAAD
jgi:hypothetical protein